MTTRSTIRPTTRRPTTRRPAAGPAPIRRFLAVTGLLATVLVPGMALAPGTARADGGSATPAPPGPLGGLAGTVGGLLDGGSPDPGASDGAYAASPPAAGQPASSPPSPDPSTQLQALLQQLQQHSQISPDCVNGVLQDVRLVISDIPQSLQDLAAQLAAGLRQGGGVGAPVPLGLPQPDGTQVLTLPAARPSSASGTGAVAIGPPADLQGSLLAGDLQKLVKDFTYDCLPQPSAPAVAGGASQAPAAPGAAEPGATPEQPAAEPVTYPGYAPTGGSAPGPASGTDPLAAIGAGLVLLGRAGVAGHRMRSRATHGRG